MQVLSSRGSTGSASFHTQRFSCIFLHIKLQEVRLVGILLFAISYLIQIVSILTLTSYHSVDRRVFETEVGQSTLDLLTLGFVLSENDDLLR